MNQRHGLVPRLFTAQLLTLAVGAVTLAVVAVLAAPALINTHLTTALGSDPGPLREHVEAAFTRTLVFTFAIGGAASVVAAAAFSLLVARRLAQPIVRVARAATDLAGGAYATRIPTPRLGVELDQLTDAFNVMAATLQETEGARRRLIGDVAHELRTPLSVITAYVEGLADGVRQADATTWAVLEQQTNRMRRLIDDLALVSRAEEHALALNRVTVNIGDIVATSAASARPAYADKGVELSVLIEPGLPPIDVDPDRVGQILTNLLSNALRHTDPPGRVRLSASAMTAGIRVTVSDEGQGIRAEDLPHVFERFYRSDAARDRGHGGSGLGLTIARALARAHGGDLTAASTGPGAGASFQLSLPRAAATFRRRNA